MTTISEYTATWDEAMRPVPPDVGDRIFVDPSADAREWDGFRRVLRCAGLDIAWDDVDEDTGYDEYVIVRGHDIE